MEAEAAAGEDADLGAEQLACPIQAVTQVPQLRIDRQQRVLEFEVGAAADLGPARLHRGPQLLHLLRLMLGERLQQAGASDQIDRHAVLERGGP